MRFDKGTTTTCTYNGEGLRVLRGGANPTTFQWDLTESVPTLGTYSYDPYGNPTAATGSIPNPFGFAGQYTDAESGLQYLRARYYDPSTGQFLTRDPIEALTRSPYAYVNGNPLNFVDPSGMSWWDPRDWSADDIWDETGGKVVSYVDDHSKGLAQIGTGIAFAGYALCPVTAGLGCAVGGTASAVLDRPLRERRSP